MRVIGGSLGGRRLRAPRTEARPTQDRVREALFNILGARVVDARFLDLFAGSGAVGIEAMSRGAAAVIWVESDKRALACLRANVRELCGAAASAVVPADVRRFMKRSENNLAAGEFDIIFSDPPYGQPEWEGRLAAALLDAGLLAPDGVWVMESMERGTNGALPGWRLTDERRYGQARLRFYYKERTMR